MDAVDWALLYAENGFSVFPLVPKTKKPMIEKGCHAATTDLNQIRKWWKYKPTAGIGLPMGKVNGLIGLDHDPKNGADKNLLQRLPATYTTLTPTGGSHPLFRFQEGIKNGKKIEVGVTVRGEGYYFVLPPSSHPDVPGIYTPLNEVPLWKAEIADLPEWVVKHPGIKEEVTKEKKHEVGGRHQALLIFATALRKDGASEDEIRAKTLFYNEKRLVEAKDVSEVEAIIRWVLINVQPDPQGAANEVIKTCGGLILDEKFKYFVDQQSSLIYEIKNIEKEEISPVPNKEYPITILAEQVFEREGMKPTPKGLAGAFSLWRAQTDWLRVPPESFRWKEEKGWTLKRLEFFPVKGQHDAWSEFLYRLSAPEDFMAFIWSCFEKENRSRQFLYLVDPNGQGGKSTVIRVIGGIFGQAFCALTNQMVNGEALRWLPSLLYGKRVVGWADCKNVKFPMSELVRNITSGDAVVVERKGEAPFTAHMRLKLIIGSNHPPEITEEGANTSRLIRIDVKENLTKNDPKWEEKLIAELPFFLHECKWAYEKKCEGGGEIELHEDTHQLILDSSEGIEVKFEDVIERRFLFGEEHETSVADWMRFIKDERYTNNEVGELKRMLRKRLGVRIKKSHFRNENGEQKTKTSYLGFKINPDLQIPNPYCD